MSPETADKLIWLGKVFQLIAAIILTPEIIGPDRFERLEEFIESRNCLLNNCCVLTLASLLAAMLMALFSVPVGIIFVVGEKSLSSGQRTLLRVLFFALAMVGWSLVPGDAPHRLSMSTLAKITAYLRTASVFRTFAIATAIALFFIGFGLELVLEWPF